MEKLVKIILLVIFTTIIIYVQKGFLLSLISKKFCLLEYSTKHKWFVNACLIKFSQVSIFTQAANEQERAINNNNN